MADTDRPRVLITGAAGSVGRNLWQGWEAAGCYDLTLTDRQQIEGSNSRMEIGDIADKDLVCRLCEGQDVLVHLAYIPHKPLADVTDIGVAMQLFEAASAAGVKRIIYASSNSAIGMNEHARLAKLKAKLKELEPMLKTRVQKGQKKKPKSTTPLNLRL